MKLSESHTQARDVSFLAGREVLSREAFVCQILRGLKESRHVNITY